MIIWISWVPILQERRLGIEQHAFSNFVNHWIGALALQPTFADRFLDSSIDSWVTADVQYTYSFGDLKYLSDASVTVGIQNLTNEGPPFVPVITGYDGTLHDPRGRLWTLRVNASL